MSGKHLTKNHGVEHGASYFFHSLFAINYEEFLQFRQREGQVLLIFFQSKGTWINIPYVDGEAEVQIM